MCTPALAIAGFATIVAASGARNSARAQQQSLLSDSIASDRAAVTADNNAKVAANNADLADWQARDALHSGDVQVGSEIRQRNLALDASNNQTATVKSNQKVALAGNGVDTAEGSAADVLTSTDYIGALNNANINDAASRNVATIHQNAVNNAWGYRTQGTGYQDQAANARADAELYRFDAGRQRSGAQGISPNSAAAVSLIGSAGQVASAWYSTKKVG